MQLFYLSILCYMFRMVLSIYSEGDGGDIN